MVHPVGGTFSESDGVMIVIMSMYCISLTTLIIVMTMAITHYNDDVGKESMSLSHLPE